MRERQYLAEAFIPLVEKCKRLNRAMRIGTNHGSMSSRVLSFYGDTPRGMTESAIEFADICRSQDYHNFVFSMKASNPLVMVQGYRLLAAEQYRLGWDYPLHLGVTEAGDGEDGRMKSAIGIGTLLSDGVGDTIRVSLTEDPEYEYEPCNRLAEIAESRLATVSEASKASQEAVEGYEDTRDITSFAKRQGELPSQVETDQVDMRGILHRDGSVISIVTPEMLAPENVQYLYQEMGCKVSPVPVSQSYNLRSSTSNSSLRFSCSSLPARRRDALQGRCNRRLHPHESGAPRLREAGKGGAEEAHRGQHWRHRPRGGAREGAA